MKLFLLTCLIALAAGAPSDRNKRNILPGDARYDHEHHQHHEVHEHHANEAEIARALGNSGCLSPLALARDYKSQEVKPETPHHSTDVEGPVPETAEAVKALEQPESVAESSPTSAKDEPVNFEKSGEPSPVDDKVPHREVETEPEAESLSQPESHTDAQEVPQNAENVPESPKSHDEAEDEHEAKPASQSEPHTETEEESSPKVDDKPATTESRIADEAKPASYPEQPAKSQKAYVPNVEQKPESAESHVADPHHQAGILPEPKSASFPEHPAVEAEKAYVPSVEQKPESADPHHQVEIKPEGKSANYPEHPVKSEKAYVPNVEQKPESAESHVADPHHQAGIFPEPKSASFPEHPAVEAEKAYVPSVEQKPESADPHHQVEIKPEAKSVNIYDKPQLPQSRIAEAQPVSQPRYNPEANKKTPDASQSAVPSPTADTKSPVKPATSQANPAPSSSATPFPSKFGSPFSPTAPKTGFGSPISPSFPSSPYSATPFYDPGFNAFDHGRYNPNFHAGLGYNPGFGGYGNYNNNYGRLGYNPTGYYPGHPTPYGTHPGLVPNVKGQPVVDPLAPVGIAHPSPFDYSRNHPYVNPHAYPLHPGYPAPQPINPYQFPSPAKEQNSGVEASQSGKQLPKSYQSPYSVAQPTADPVKKSY